MSDLKFGAIVLLVWAAAATAFIDYKKPECPAFHTAKLKSWGWECTVARP